MGADVKITRRDGSPVLGYVCPECNEWSPVTSWREGEVYCESCGDHRTMVCPACEMHTDTVFTDFEDADDFLKAEADAKAEAEWQAAEKATYAAYGKVIAPMEELQDRIRRTTGSGGEDLACAIAETMLGWKATRDGEDECEVLVPGGTIPDWFKLMGKGRYPRAFFIPKVQAYGPVRWFASIEEALALAEEILKPEQGLMWSRDPGGRFTLASGNPLDRWSGSWGPHVSTDALAIIDAAIAAKIRRLRPEPKERPKPTRAMPLDPMSLQFGGLRTRYSKVRP